MDKIEKSPNAYRTISEVSDHLDVPQHVLRFWETKFPQVAPMKRAGNRRYYDPQHIGLLSRIRDLLYIEGYTTKGVQKLLDEGRLLEGAADNSDQVDNTTQSASLMDLTSQSRTAAFNQEPENEGGLTAPPQQVDYPTDEGQGTLTSLTKEVLNSIAGRLRAARASLRETLDEIK